MKLYPANGADGVSALLYAAADITDQGIAHFAQKRDSLPEVWTRTSMITGCKFQVPQNTRRLINVYAINFMP